MMIRRIAMRERIELAQNAVFDVAMVTPPRLDLVLLENYVN